MSHLRHVFKDECYVVLLRFFFRSFTYTSTKNIIGQVQNASKSSFSVIIVSILNKDHGLIKKKVVGKSATHWKCTPLHTRTVCRIDGRTVIYQLWSFAGMIEMFCEEKWSHHSIIYPQDVLHLTRFFGRDFWFQMILYIWYVQELSYNTGQSIWKKTNESKANWTRPQKLDVCFCVIFDHYCRHVFFLEQRLTTRMCLHPILRFFLMFPNFLRH